MNFKTIFYILLILIGLDFISTFVGITMLDISEANPLYRFGFLNFFIIKLIATTLALTTLLYVKNHYPNMSMTTVLILVGWYTAVFVNNIYIIGCAIYG